MPVASQPAAHAGCRCEQRLVRLREIETELHTSKTFIDSDVERLYKEGSGAFLPCRPLHRQLATAVHYHPARISNQAHAPR